MLKFVILLACVAAALGGKLDRVIGGKTAEPGQFPYLVSIRLKGSDAHHCGGAIIDPRYILTSAQCVYQYRARDFIVVAGSTTIDAGGEVYGVEAFGYHGSFDQQSKEHDIAMLKTNTDIVFNSNVNSLPIATSEVPADSEVIVSGWGLTSYPADSPPNDLKYSYLTSMDHISCLLALSPDRVYSTEICTSTKAGNGVCVGDSGSPLVYKGTLVGIASWAHLCAIGDPDVFTKVSDYQQWISDSMIIL